MADTSHDPRAIANAFLALSARRDLSAAVLEKLVYFAHGWSLAIDRQPLIDERIEAGDSGPRVRSIHHHDMTYDRSADGLIERIPGQAYTCDLTEEQSAIVASVWKRYANHTAYELAFMTMMPGTPWANIYFAMRSDKRLSNEAIRRYFIRLALAGRAENAVHRANFARVGENRSEAYA